MTNTYNTLRGNTCTILVCWDGKWRKSFWWWHDPIVRLFFLYLSSARLRPICQSHVDSRVIRVWSSLARLSRDFVPMDLNKIPTSSYHHRLYSSSPLALSLLSNFREYFLLHLVGLPPNRTRFHLHPLKIRKEILMTCIVSHHEKAM